MEPVLTTFALNLASAVAYDMLKSSIVSESVENDIKDAFEESLKDWASNKDVRERKRRYLKQMIKTVIEKDQFSTGKIEDADLADFYEVFQKRLCHSKHQTAYNYLKDKKDDAYHERILNELVFIKENIGSKNGADVAKNRAEKIKELENRNPIYPFLFDCSFTVHFSELEINQKKQVDALGEWAFNQSEPDGSYWGYKGKTLPSFDAGRFVLNVSDSAIHYGQYVLDADHAFAYFGLQQDALNLLLPEIQISFCEKVHIEANQEPIVVRPNLVFASDVLKQFTTPEGTEREFRINFENETCQVWIRKASSRIAFNDNVVRSLYSCENGGVLISMILPCAGDIVVELESFVLKYGPEFSSLLSLINGDNIIEYPEHDMFQIFHFFVPLKSLSLSPPLPE